MKKKEGSLKNNGKISEDILESIRTIHDFIHQVTGQPPSDIEIASALSRYFVLNEIKEHIIMERSKKEDIDSQTQDNQGSQ